MGQLKNLQRLLDERNLVEAVELLSALSRGPGAKSRAFELARYWRIAHRPLQALRLLHPFVYPQAGGRRQATKTSVEEVRFEYASSLVLAGAAREALRILESIPFERIPAVARQAYLAADRLWVQERSIPGLRRFIALESEPRLSREAARIELADTQLYGLNAPAACLDLLDEVEKNLAKGGFDPWIALNLTQIRLQALYVLGDDSGASAAITRLREGFRVERINPWVALEARLYELLIRAKDAGAGRLPELRRGLDEARAGFLQVGRFAFARLGDAYWALATRDADAFRRVYFSTPLASFREKYREWARDKVDLASLRLDAGVDLPGGLARPLADLDWVLDLESGGLVSTADDRPAPGTGEIGKLRPLPLRLLCVLAADPYRPLILVELHERIYPDAPFDPLHGAARLHRGLARLRAWFQEIPALRGTEVRQSQGRYSLILPPTVGIRSGALGPRAAAPLRERERVNALRERLRGEAFTSPEASRALQISERSARRFLGQAVAAGLLLRVGTGPATSYRFPPRD